MPMSLVAFKGKISINSWILLILILIFHLVLIQGGNHLGWSDENGKAQEAPWSCFRLCQNLGSIWKEDLENYSSSVNLNLQLFKAIEPMVNSFHDSWECMISQIHWIRVLDDDSFTKQFWRECECANIQPSIQ